MKEKSKIIICIILSIIGGLLMIGSLILLLRIPYNRGYSDVFETLIISGGIMQLVFLALSYMMKNRSFFKGALFSTLYTVAYILVILNILIFGGLFFASLGADVNTH